MKNALHFKTCSHEKYFVRMSVALLSLIVGSCSESLPPYQDPADVFQGKVAGQYVLTVQDNSVKVYVTVKNIYDETFQASAILRGSLEITLARRPEIRKTVSLFPSQIIEGHYNSGTGILTIDPGETIRLGYSWNFIDNSGTDLRKEIFTLVDDPTCSLRRIAYDETFSLKGEVTIFEKTAPVRFGPTMFTFCYITNWVNSKFCPPPQTDVPCNRRPTTQQAVPTKD
jgi:hypothetical protein